MNTLSPHLAVATVLVARHVSLDPSLAATQATAHTAGGVGSVAALIVVLAVVLLLTMARAARGMADLMAGFLRIAASMTSSLLAVIFIVLVTVALLAYR